MTAQSTPFAAASPFGHASLHAPKDGEVVLLCPAKLNLALCVGAPGADGFHPLASAMLALAFGDDLRLKKAQATHWTRAFSPTAPRPVPVDWPEEKDLACRAHRLLEEAVGRALPVEAQLTKRIPAGAGLGGGSSNAAGALVGLDRLFELRLPVETLCGLAAKLGSDVPFFVHALTGSPLCVATGRGEKLEPMPMPAGLANAWFALTFPHAACATPAVYRAFDAQGAFGDPAGTGHRLVHAVARDEADAFNDLEAPAAAVASEVGLVLAQWRGQGFAAQLTGSGSCCFVRAADYGTADEAASFARMALDLPTRMVRVYAAA